jgi:HD superfamily phosphohydrolase
MTAFMEEKVFKDPVHDSIYVKHQLIWDLINSKAMQRLRYIKQLGTSYLTFHGAEHSRFSHSLGTYETMRKVLSHFKRNHGFYLGEREELLALSVALLHDLGHGPFSHTFEHCFNCHHEHWTARIVLEDEELNDIFRHVDDTFAFDIVKVLRKESDYPIIQELLSSQLDVDRMDYLLRDANSTGVMYGHYELERLIRIMRPADERIVIKKSGVHTIEQYLLARYFMYTQVYMHHVTIGADILIEKILQRAKYCYKDGRLRYIPPELCQMFEGRAASTTVDQYLNLDDCFLLQTFRKWTEEPDAILADLAGRIWQRRLFKSIPYRDVSPEMERDIIHAFAEVGIDPNYYIEFRSTSTSHFIYRQGIICCDEFDNCQDIGRLSNIIGSLGSHTQNRLYFAKDIIDGSEYDVNKLERLLDGLAKGNDPFDRANTLRD